LLLWSSQAVWGQGVTATLTARDKQVQIGRPFEVELSVRHPERTIVVFPDSAKDFKPYEVQSGKSIPTATNEGISEDRKIYKLYTWEIDSVQRLQFPVRYLDAKGDTAILLSNEVSVEFLPMIPAFSDTLKVKVITNLAEIREPVNWLAWGIIACSFLLIVFIIMVVFSKPIRKWFKRMRIEREFKRHLGQLEVLRALGGDPMKFYPGLNKVWRNYFDRQWSRALGSMTTLELREALPDLQVLDDQDRNALERLSQTTDMVLYAERPQPEEQSIRFWEEVRRIMFKEYARRKEAAEV
jgi:hypothetical protein